MRRFLILTTLALVLLGAGVASAAFRSGFYSGRTVSNRPVSFSVTQARLSNLRIGVIWNCTDGDRFQSRLSGFPGQAITKVVIRVRGRPVTQGRYNAGYTGSTGASTYTSRGRVLGSRATGTFTGRRTYNTNDDLDPNGTIICRTGTVSYSILRQ